MGRLVGLVERPLYVAAFLANEPAFVGIWLGLKVAGGWKGWQEDIQPNDHTKKKIPGRTIFNVMLIGSALSLAYGWVGAYGIRQIQWHNVTSAVVVAGALSIAHSALYWSLQPRSKSTAQDAHKQ
jgi:hypothetical protein